MGMQALQNVHKPTFQNTQSFMGGTTVPSNPMMMRTAEPENMDNFGYTDIAEE